jgi:tRNA(adenine34) deaminase
MAAMKAKQSTRSRRRSSSHRASATKSSRTRKASGHRKGSDNRWSGKVTTASTSPPKDLYTKDTKTIARVMATKKVSPKGLGSAIRMVQFYINRAGKTLSAARKHELEKAKGLLQEKAARTKGS